MRCELEYSVAKRLVVTNLDLERLRPGSPIDDPSSELALEGVGVISLDADPRDGEPIGSPVVRVEAHGIHRVEAFRNLKAVGITADERFQIFERFDAVE